MQLRGRLTQLEVELRDALKKAALMAQRLLPRDDSISLQEPGGGHVQYRARCGTFHSHTPLLLGTAFGACQAQRRPCVRTAPARARARAGGLVYTCTGPGIVQHRP